MYLMCIMYDILYIGYHIQYLDHNIGHVYDKYVMYVMYVMYMYMIYIIYHTLYTDVCDVYVYDI